MNKIIVFIISIVLIISCNKNEIANTLEGTKWTASYWDDVIVIEFTPSNNFQEYKTDIQGNIISTLDVNYGTYTFDGTTVLFTCNFTSNQIDKATINGNIMVLTYKSGYQRTFMKK